MPEAPFVIVNPVAGAGRAARLIPWLRERLEARPEAVLRVSSRRGEAEGWASEAASSGHDRVVAVGGDGTVQEVINGLRAGPGSSAQLGIVPVGSGNDLARSLGLPGEPGAAWRISIGECTRPIDLGLAQHDAAGATRWFAAAGGIGFDAQVAGAMAQRRGWQAGRAGYLLTTLVELRRFANRSVRLDLDGTIIERQVLLVAIANGAYYGGGMRIAPAARPDDGHLDVCVVGDISRRTALRELPSLYSGTHGRNPAVSMHTARSIVVEGDDATRVHLDGEPFGTLPVRIAIHPAAIEVATAARPDRALR